jgi:hypothetical protein
MKRKDDTEFLLKKAGKILIILESAYAKCLNRKNIHDKEFKLNILFLLVCLRSILDYLSKDICDKYSIEIESKEHRNFPICDVDKKTFDNWDIVKKLKEKNEDLYEYLLSLQPIDNNPRTLKYLKDLVNSNKHDSLTPHAIKQEVGVGINGICFRSLTVGGGGRFVDKNGNDLVRTHETINNENVDGLKQRGKINDSFSKTQWDGIYFKDIDEKNAITLLKDMTHQVKVIKENIYGFLNK